MSVQLDCSRQDTDCWSLTVSLPTDVTLMNGFIPEGTDLSYANKNKLSYITQESTRKVHLMKLRLTHRLFTAPYQVSLEVQIDGSLPLLKHCWAHGWSKRKKYRTIHFHSKLYLEVTMTSVHILFAKGAKHLGMQESNRMRCVISHQERNKCEGNYSRLLLIFLHFSAIQIFFFSFWKKTSNPYLKPLGLGAFQKALFQTQCNQILTDKLKGSRRSPCFAVPVIKHKHTIDYVRIKPLFI